MRQLVTLRTISELIPIEGADVIELAKIDGWQCIVKKGDFMVGERGLYFEIDSLIPSDDARFEFLSRGKIQAHYRIKTMKMRGTLSQGLLMRWDIMTADETCRATKSGAFDGVAPEGETLADVFKVQKYEPPLPTSGKQKGTFPIDLVPKTDQERIQNMPRELEGRTAGEFEITEKLDGTSATFWYHNDSMTAEDFEDPMQGHMCRRACTGVASRNWEMKQDDENVYARLFQELELEGKLVELGRNLAIQGEIIGPAIQKNKYKRGKQEFYVFDMYDIDAKSFLDPVERLSLCLQLGLTHVPLILHKADFPLDLETVLEFAEGKSGLYDTQREGLVFKEKRGALTFKVISNKFLLKHE